MKPAIENHIEKTPGVCGGKPRIAGHRIRVQDIVMDHEAGGLSPDDIVDAYPNLTLSQVHAALAYYYSHRDEIQSDIEEDRSYAEEFQRDHPEQIVSLNGRDAPSTS